MAVAVEVPPKPMAQQTLWRITPALRPKIGILPGSLNTVILKACGTITANIPEYYQGAVLKAMSVGALQGEEKDKDGVHILNVSEDLCRTLTVLDRMDLLG